MDRNETELLGAYALAALSLNMGMMTLLTEKGLFTEQESAGLLRFAKAGIKQGAAAVSEEMTERAVATIDEMASGWRARAKKN